MKDNKLLAEYLGFVTSGYGQIGKDEYSQMGYYKGGVLISNASNWKPDTDWNQLMMVVEKISKELAPHFNLDISPECLNEWYCSLIETNMRMSISKGETMIEAVYNACVEYITLSGDKNGI